LPAQPGKPERYDYEYERAGTAVNFLLTEPLGCWRKINVRAHRTRGDWAQEIKELLDVDYPDALSIRLIGDNLNTHTIGSFSEAFAPTEARQLIKRLEMHYTPKQGSWLNVAEIELSIFTKQCLQRRIPDRSPLQREASAWSQTRTAIQKGGDWQFTKEDARIQLKSLYPQFQN
jgi:hypothetical protein